MPVKEVRTERTAAPTALPVEPADFEEFVRVTDPDETSAMGSLLWDATEALEDFLGRSLMTQTWVQWIDGVPSTAYIDLLRGPFQSITTVNYYDLSDGEQTLSTDVYDLDATGWRLVLKAEQSWESDVRALRTYKVTMQTGYASASAVPRPLREAVCRVADHMWHNRPAGPHGIFSDMMFKQLVAPYNQNLGY